MSVAQSVSDGALFDLGAIGVEERYTVCDPQTSFFVQCCSRHTNFAFAQLEFGFEQRVSNLQYWTSGHILEGRMPKHGDLLLGTWFKPTFGRLTIPVDTIERHDVGSVSPLKEQYLQGAGDEDVNLHWCEELGFASILQADWTVGANLMDRLEGSTLHMYHEKGTPEGRILRNAIGKQRSGNYINSSYTNTNALRTFSATNRVLYVPLLFSYMRGGVENAFPHVAIQYDEIRYKISLRGRAELIIALDTSDPNDPVGISKADPRSSTACVTGGALLDAAMVAELAFLDKPEQASFTTSSFQKYFEFTQMAASTRVAAQDKVVTIPNLRFNHAVVQVSAFYLADAKVADNVAEYFNFSTPLPNALAPDSVSPYTGLPLAGLTRELNPFESIEIQYSSAPRVSREGIYFHEVVPFLRHKRIDDSFSLVYSFAVDPERHTCPTGASNMGRWPQVPMRMTFVDSYESSNVLGTGILGPGEVRVLALTQNFYKIAGGRLAVRWSAV